MFFFVSMGAPNSFTGHNKNGNENREKQNKQTQIDTSENGKTIPSQSRFLKLSVFRSLKEMT